MKMFDIILINPALWVNFIVVLIISAYLIFKGMQKQYFFNTKGRVQYILVSLGVQSAVAMLLLFFMYFLLFSSTTDILSKTYYNTSVKQLTYYESWTELVYYTETTCTGSGQNQKCTTRTKTRHDYHPEYYELETNDGYSQSVSKQAFLNSKKIFGANFVNLLRSNQVSFGDGNKYVSTITGVVPYSYYKEEVNYIRAVKQNILNKEQENLLGQFKNLLVEYPKQYNGFFENKLVYRVIDPLNVLDKNIKDKLDSKLQFYSAVNGKTKQVNSLIYVVPEVSVDFKNALESFWKGGAKNDAILIISVKDNKILWSDSIAFTKNVDFIMNTKNYRDIELENLAEVYSNEITKNFSRTSMKEYEYLKHNISLPVTTELLLLLLNAFVAILVGCAMQGISLREKVVSFIKSKK